MLFSQFADKVTCAYCGATGRAPTWPVAGDFVPFYHRTKEGVADAPGAFRIPIICTACGKEYYIVWDEDPQLTDKHQGGSAGQKVCAICGEAIGANVIQCPKCGKGVFETKKTSSWPTDLHARIPEERAKHKGKGFWRRLFGFSEPAQPDDTSEKEPFLQTANAGQKVVKCSKCGRTLTQHEPDVFSAMIGDSWFGTICTNCSLVFCEKCLDAGGSAPCPKCGKKVIPAIASYLPEK